MPTTITGTDGVAYHLWQLPDASAPEPEDTHSFTTLDNEMSEGYRTTQLFGLQSGLREWRLTFPTLATSTVIPAAVTDPYGATVSREQYVRNVYKYSRTTGIPFVYSDPNHNGQYYLVDAVDDELTMKKMKGVGIYGSELTFRQRRLPGVSVFDPTKIGKYANLHWYNETSHGAGVWTDKKSLGGLNLTASGDVVFSANPFDGKNTVRLSGSATTGGLSVATSADIADAFIVFKIRTPPASGTASIIHPDHGGAATPILRTLTASAQLTSTIFDVNITGNDDVDDQFAAVQASGMRGSFQTFVGTPLLWYIGANVGAGTNYAKIDIAELWLFEVPINRRDAYESAEHLRTKWHLA